MNSGTVLRFGKYKGMPIGDVDETYLIWMCQHFNSSIWKRLAIAELLDRGTVIEVGGNSSQVSLREENSGKIFHVAIEDMPGRSDDINVPDPDDDILVDDLFTLKADPVWVSKRLKELVREGTFYVNGMVGLKEEREVLSNFGVENPCKVLMAELIIRGKLNTAEHLEGSWYLVLAKFLGLDFKVKFNPDSNSVVIEEEASVS